MRSTTIAKDKTAAYICIFKGLLNRIELFGSLCGFFFDARQFSFELFSFGPFNIPLQQIVKIDVPRDESDLYVLM